MFSGQNPSTSFRASMVSITFCSEMCFGNGNCTINPSKSGSLFSSTTLASNSASVTLSSKRTSVDRKPTSAQSFILKATYDSLPPSCPTRTAARCGALFPEETICFTSSAISAFTCSEMALPSII